MASNSLVEPTKIGGPTPKPVIGLELIALLPCAIGLVWLFPFQQV